MKSKYTKHTLLNSRGHIGKIKNGQLEKETTVSSTEVSEGITAGFIVKCLESQGIESEQANDLAAFIYGSWVLKSKSNSPSTTVKEEGQLFIWNGIEGDLEEVADLKAAKKYIWDYMEDGEIHPDIECIKLFRQIGYVKVEETGEMNGDDPVCTVDFIFNQESGTKI